MYEVELYLGSAFTGDTLEFPLFDSLDSAIAAVSAKIGQTAVVERHGDSAVVYADGCYDYEAWYLDRAY